MSRILLARGRQPADDRFHDAPDDTAHDDAFIAVVLTDVAVLTDDLRRRVSPDMAAEPLSKNA
jgi:hypothetical protein